MIDDEVVADPLLSQVMIGAVPDTRVWLFDVATAIAKLPKVIASDKRYFVIGKSPVTLQRPPAPPASPLRTTTARSTSGP